MTTPFQPGEMVVYPTRGVGRVLDLETQAVDGLTLSVYVIHFESERLTLRLPVSKAVTAGLRRLSTQDDVDKAFVILGEAPVVRRGMWNRRVILFESKINSGCLSEIAEVLRDLHKPEAAQTFGERTLYRQALMRLAGEIGHISGVSFDQALFQITNALSGLEQSA